MPQRKIRFNCIEITQPIGTFYVGVMDYSDLITISHSDVRRLERKEREVETYIGIERPLSESRVKEIGKYVNLVDATFPTGVILAVNSENVLYSKKDHAMEIVAEENVAKVLDGQHRIAGLAAFAQEGMKFQINVALFVDMELEDQAIVFATINKAQTKVNKSLVADLFEFAKSRSPQKTAHSIARALNEKEGSPFFGKIKILGVADDKEKETITQATFVESLMKYLSKDPMSDRDVYKRNRKLTKVTGEELKKFFFRNLFIEQKDTEIAQIIWNYFSAVRNKWPNSWEKVEPEMILNRSTGFIALMRFLKDAYLSFERIGEIVSVEEFNDIFRHIDISEKSITREKYLPGSTGQRQFYEDLLSKSDIN
jgi:DGQHR domain-containing protein